MSRQAALPTHQSLANDRDDLKGREGQTSTLPTPTMADVTGGHANKVVTNEPLVLSGKQHLLVGVKSVGTDIMQTLSPKGVLALVFVALSEVYSCKYLTCHTNESLHHIKTHVHMYMYTYTTDSWYVYHRPTGGVGVWQGRGSPMIRLLDSNPAFRMALLTSSRLENWSAIVGKSGEMVTQ